MDGGRDAPPVPMSSRGRTLLWAILAAAVLVAIVAVVITLWGATGPTSPPRPP